MTEEFIDYTDEQLFFKFRAGDENAFTKLYMRHHMGIAKQIGNYVRNQADIEELVLQVFHTFSRMAKYNPELSSLKTTLFWITKNKTIDYLRQNKDKYHEISIESIDNNKIVEKSAAEVEDDKLQQTLKLLSDRDRTLLELRYFQGLSLEEIASTLKISYASAKVGVHRAKQELKKKLDELDK
ncbi:MAG: sigma-70 family RNA polymerase sigma factor [Blastocatellia bacterium]